MPDDRLSYLLASLPFINLAETDRVRCLQKLCAATVPALHWGTSFQLLFALPCEGGLYVSAYMIS